MIIGFDGCSFGIGLVVAGIVVLFALRLFVDWKWWRPQTYRDYVDQEVERAGRVPLPILAVGVAVAVGGVLVLALDGC